MNNNPYFTAHGQSLIRNINVFLLTPLYTRKTSSERSHRSGKVTLVRNGGQTLSHVLLSFHDAVRLGDTWCGSWVWCEHKAKGGLEERPGRFLGWPHPQLKPLHLLRFPHTTSLDGLAGLAKTFELCHLFSIFSKNSTLRSGHSLRLGAQPYVPLSVAQRPPPSHGWGWEAVPQNDFSQCALK